MGMLQYDSIIQVLFKVEKVDSYTSAIQLTYELFGAVASTGGL